MIDYSGIRMVADDNNNRFALIKDGKRMLYVFGVNPSTATDTKSDPTMSKVIGFARENGFDGFAMMNLYPLRSTNPFALPKMIDENLHQKNLEMIKEIIGKEKNPIVLLSFGDSIRVVPYLFECLRDILSVLQPLNPKWKQIGTPTKKGNPRHPSHAAYSLGIHDFDLITYLKTIK